MILNLPVAKVKKDLSGVNRPSSTKGFNTITQPVPLTCVPHNSHNRRKDMLQILFYPDGTYRVGIDVWRDLNKYDCSSHSVETYHSLEELEKKYEIINT